MHSIKQKSLSAIVFVFSLIFIMPATADAQFSDISIDHPQYEAIMYLYENGIIKGYDDGTFKPNALVTKAEFLKMLFNHVGYLPRQGFYETPFTDVGSGYWFAPYVKKALEMDLIEVNEDWPVFLGASPVERIEALKMLMPLEGIPTPYTDETTTIFNDISPDYKYFRLVKGAEKSGVFIEEENPVFFPGGLLTRGDVAELLYKTALFKDENPDQVVPTVQIDLTEPSFIVEDDQSDLMTSDKFPIFVSVWNKINDQYLYKENINDDELIYGAIGGMVDSLEDPYSLFQKPELADELWDTLEGNYEGIGTIIDTYEDQFIIIGVINNSPADKAGLKTGDIILSIDGESFSTNEINDMINAIKGPAGSKVELKIDRDGETKSFSITREQITLDTVLLEANSTEVPSSLGYIAIYQFTDSTTSEFDKILTQTLADDPKGLIIDLRDNPGGYVDSALDILGYFFEKGETVAKLKIADQYISERSPGAGTLKDMPIVVLVNENTASAAEIVAAALQEKKSAKLIGEQTYGKGTVQEVNIYTDGSLLKLSIAKWLTPDGNDIDHLGIKPTIEVVATKDDAVGKTDSQLQKAIDELEKMI